MKVKELIEWLQTEDQEAEVVMSSDPEGNSFSPLFDISNNARYDRDCGEVGLKTLTPELEKSGHTEEDIGYGVDCIVLWP